MDNDTIKFLVLGAPIVWCSEICDVKDVEHNCERCGAWYKCRDVCKVFYEQPSECPIIPTAGNKYCECIEWNADLGLVPAVETTNRPDGWYQV